MHANQQIGMHSIKSALWTPSSPPLSQSLRLPHYEILYIVGVPPVEHEKFFANTSHTRSQTDELQIQASRCTDTGGY